MNWESENFHLEILKDQDDVVADFSWYLLTAEERKEVFQLVASVLEKLRETKVSPPKKKEAQ